MIRSNRRFLTVAAATLLALTVGGLALADESETTEADGAGAPWRLTDSSWVPGSDTPPPWAGGTDAEGDDVGDGPRWLRDDAEGWLPGDEGPPPWSNARWLRDDAEGWQPGDGMPPWANGEDDGDEGDDDGEGPRWLRDDAEGWQPGDGKPPWAGQGDDDVDADDDEADEADDE